MFRKLLAPLFVAPLLVAHLFVSSVASASSGMVVLKSGEILDGELVEVVPGDHVTLKAGSGPRVIAWNEVFSLRLASQAAAKPEPAPEPAPVVTYIPPPSPHVVDRPTMRFPTTGSDFRGRFSVGARGSMISGSGEALKANGRTFAMTDLVGDGAALQLDGGYHFSPAWTFFGAYEYASFGRGERAAASENAPVGHAAFVGFKANSNPKGPIGFYFEIGAGWRWLRFSSSNSSASAVAGGPVPLKMGLGVSVVATDRVRIDAILSSSVGMLTRFDIPDACVNAKSSDCNTIAESNRTFHYVQTASIAGSWDL